MTMFLRIVVFSTLLTVSELVSAQAFCALRDPLSVIGELTRPQPQSFSSEVVNIDPQLAQRIAGLTGGLAVNHQELGYHTLYNVDTGDPGRPGVVHVRPEASKWGVVEIAWLLTPQGQVLNFEFQRCRSSACSTLDTDAVRSFFKENSRASMLEMLADTGDAYSGVAPITGLDENAEELLLSMIRSAIKASAVIEIMSAPASG